MASHVADMFIDFIGNDDDTLVLYKYILQRFQFLTGIDTSGGVAGRAEDDGAGAGGDGCFQLFGGNLEVLLNGGFDVDGFTVGQLHHLGVRNPVGGRDNDLISLVHDCHDDIAHALLGSVRTENLGRSVFQSVLVLEFVYNGLLQCGIAGNGAVAGVVFLYGAYGCFLDVVGGVEVGFAHAHVDYVHTLCLKLCAALAHGQGCARCQSVQSVGKCLHIL